MKKVVAALLLIPLISGCTTTQQRYDNAVNLPVNRVFKYQEQGGLYNLVIFRDSGFSGHMCDIAIYLNKERVVRLNTGEKAQLLVAPGTLWLSANLEGNRFCADYNMAEKNIVLEQSDVKVLRISTFGAGNIDIQIMQPNSE